MRSREISVSIIIQNLAQLKALFEKQWESIVGNCDEFLYLGGNEQSTHEYVSKLLGKETIDTNTYGRSRGRNGSYSTNYQLTGRELMTPDEVRMLDNRYALLFMNTMKNAFMVAIGKKTRNELSYELIRDMFVSGGALTGSLLGKVGGAAVGGVIGTYIGGPAGVAVAKALSVAGSLLGSFVGSVAGTFVFNTVYKTAITFCIDTGVTLFGIVDQDYKLPEDVLIEIGLETFDFESFQADTFEPDTFTFETFEAESIQPDTLGITMLRRGVIGVSKIGYVAS